MVTRVAYIGLVLLFNFVSSQSGQAQSVLSSGKWAKLGITQEGIYKIDFQLLQELGINPQGIDPENLRLFGQPGGLLPQANDEPRPFDLAENALYAIGLEDGSFDANDLILFYTGGPHLQKIDNQGNLKYQRNIYADTVFHFLNWDEAVGKRMGITADLGKVGVEFNTFTDYRVHEQDLENLLNSGREWYGEIVNNQNTLHLAFENLAPLTNEGSLSLITRVINRSESTATVQLAANGMGVGSFDITAIGSDTYDPEGVAAIDTLTIDQNLIAGSDQIDLDLSYSTSSGGRGNLDYLLLTFESDLEFRGQPLRFREPRSLDEVNASYSIRSDMEQVIIWDITDPQNVTIQNYQYANGVITFGSTSNQLREYIIFRGEDFPAPLSATPVNNQDIKSYPTPDLLIITHPSWRQQAERLADFRASHDGLTTLVVTPEEIYNEFSSGSQDVTAIRDYVRFLYQKSTQLKYLLLFGRGSYDYKDIRTGNTNYVPTYQSRNSLDPIFSHNSDDFFTFLDAEEGMWREQLSGSGGHIMDISVGRLPVTSSQQARTVVDKLIHYATSPESLGRWRQDIYYIADDGDFNLHQRDANHLADLVDTASHNFNVHKVFLDAFPQQKTPNGESAEVVNTAINDIIKKGALIINYTGHGSEFRWADETILNQSMIDSWENYQRLPFFVTATCEFGRHDDPARISGAEKLITNPNGGAIGLVTTARPVFASKNFILNRAFYQVALEATENGFPTLGEIFRFVKNDSHTIVANRNFSLLGDPSMKLAYPRYNLVITSIENGAAVLTDTLEALSLVSIEGEVRDTDGRLLQNYQGTAQVTVFDKQTTSRTLGSDGQAVFSFKERNSILFRGSSSIEQGRFKLSFVVPKNINYQIGSGKISLYSADGNGLIDAGGAEISFKVGGSNPNPIPDRDPPEIRLFMDDITFKSGGATGSDTQLLAHLSDSSGINISNTGFGQDITMSLNHDEPVKLNDFYLAELDSYTNGWVNYPLTDLEEGDYTLNLKAWDVYNNSNEATLEFVVVENPALALHRVMNYPNPFNLSTTFHIDHNQAGETLHIAIEIYDQKGQIVRIIEKEFTESPSTLDGIDWNGADEGGAPLKSGLYLYKVVVNSLTTGHKSEAFRKLVLIK